MEGDYRVIESEWKVIEEKPAAYWKSSAFKPRNFYDTGMETDLEKIVLEDDIMQEDSATGIKVFADKGKTLKSTIKALFNEILTREMLNDVLLKKIDSDTRRTETYLHEIRGLTVRDYSRQFADTEKRRTQLDGRLMDLEKQRRDEYLQCWKDLGQLKKYVLLNLRDFWNLKNKSSFMEYEVDDSHDA